MIQKARVKIYKLLRWSEQYTKTDMVYLAKSSFWINASTVTAALFAFALSIAFSRFVSKETYGIYQFLISISSMLGVLTLTGMNSAVTQAVSRGFEGVFKNSIKIQIKFSVIPFLAGIIASLYYFINGNQTISISIFAIALLLPFANAFNTWGGFLGGKKDFKNAFRYAQIINFIYYAGMIACIYFFPKTVALIITNFFLLTITNLIVYLIVLKKYKPNKNNDNETLAYGKKLSLSNILPTIALSIDSLAIFHFLGATELAIYAFASNIPIRLGGLLRPISMAAFPKFAEKKPEELKKVLPRKTLQLFILSLTGGIIYILLAPFIFKIFFPQYMESVFYSQVYAINVVIGITANLLMTSLSATRSEKVFLLNILNPFFNIIAVVSLIYFFGIWGAIAGKMISNGFALLSNYLLQKNN